MGLQAIHYEENYTRSKTVRGKNLSDLTEKFCYTALYKIGLQNSLSRFKMFHCDFLPLSYNEKMEDNVFVVPNIGKPIKDEIQITLNRNEGKTKGKYFK